MGHLKRNNNSTYAGLVDGHCRPVRHSHTRPALPMYLPGPAKESENNESEVEEEEEEDDRAQGRREQTWLKSVYS